MGRATRHLHCRLYHTHSGCGRPMAVKYKARAVMVFDSESGRKVLHWRMTCGTPVEIEVDPNQLELVIREVPLETPIS